LSGQVEDKASTYKFSDGRTHCVEWDDNKNDDDDGQ
jgi:hypothetical protein